MRASAVAEPVSPAGAPVRRIALVGNPNSGKTTVFNALTGLRQKVGNYPGTTVERRTGLLRDAEGGAPIEVIDLPGAYSLVAASPDERIVADVLRGARAGERPPDVVIAVVDASNLARNLYLVSQVAETGAPLVVALNMMDVARRHGMEPAAAAIEEALGCPVVPVVGSRRQGIADLRAALARAARPAVARGEVPEAMAREEADLARGIGTSDGAGGDEALAIARRLLVGDPGARARGGAKGVGVAVDAALERLRSAGVDPVEADVEARYRWIDDVVARAVPGRAGATAPDVRTTERLDAVLLHPVWGLFAFVAIMGSLFASIFWLAKPLMNGVQAGVAWLAAATGSAMAPGPLRALVVDGVFAGVGAVLVFVPQVALLFLFLGLLEDSGYLARAAFLMDRALSRVGLHGKSFVPLLSSFACAIPGILATRTMDGRRDRLATILVAPFMSCSARLPVYTLLVGACFGGLGAFSQGLVMLSLYLVGIAGAAVVSLLLKGRLEGGRRASLVLELPTYKAPQPSLVLWQAWTGTRAFLARAGTTIFAMSVVLWALAYYPRLPAAEIARLPDEGAQRAAQIEHSIAGRVGHVLEPAIRPIGFDWKTGVGLVGAFAAREVFVSTLGIVYATGGSSENSTDLRKAMIADRRPDGAPVWTPVAAASLLVWFVLAMQCLSTMAVVWRETGSWRWTAAQLVGMNAVAYVACLAVYQFGGRLFGS